ncbi:uncharacterized protein LOC121373090 [Gigantopelta aegis]|uniref:uncharacterized protein LOC121373090 n=1 Tax=Gigantopelta aegis TaxID=1735272 RepID=UPI001B88C8E5|nr:uncharacterized protein LOC121373090 [Gigantopelta aegis]
MPNSLPVNPLSEFESSVTIVNKNFTTDPHFPEWYDNPGNRDPEVPTRCDVQALASSDNKDLFGITKTANGTDRIYSVNGALHFGGKIPTNYLGRVTVRGITVEEWESCQYWSDMDATMKVKWYFTVLTAKNVWHPAINVNQIPVRCDVQGVRWVGPGASYHFHHVYEFTDYRPGDVSDTDFEIPPGTFCPHRKNTKKLPTLRKAFSFSSEIVMPETKSITFLKEYYDFGSDVVRYDYVPPVNSPYGTNILYEVHDYSTGVAYITDSVLGNCSVRPIQATSFDAKAVGPNTVRIRTSREFFNFQNADYHYVGVRTVRGLKCDVWVARRTDWPPGVAGVNSTFEWYFATPHVTEYIGYGSGETRVPIMLEVTGILSGQKFHYIFNYYDFDNETPLSWNFDISPCYNYTNSKTIQFALSGHYRDLIIINKEMFKSWLLMAIRDATNQISALRVSNIQVDIGNADIIVSFRLLGVAPIRGDVTSPVKQLSLADAVDFITAAINSKKFGIKVVTPTVLREKVFLAKPFSVKSWDTVIQENAFTEPAAGYGDGVMAGAAIGIFLGAFILGFAVLFLVYKRFGGSFKPKKFDDLQPVLES